MSVMPSLTPNSRIFQQRGFSFIELLVIISVSGILIGMGVVSFNNHQKKQKTEQAALNLETNLKQIRQMALSGQRPIVYTGELKNYRIDFELEFNRYSYRILFDDVYTPALKTYLISDDNNINLDPDTTDFILRFYTLGGGCDNGTDGETGTYNYTMINSDLDGFACTVSVQCPNGDIKFVSCI